MAGLGLFFASVLAVVNKKLKVKEDPGIERIEKALPGVNCGVCGFANCRQYAEALVKEETSPSQCKAGGEEVINRLSEILNIKIEKKVDRIAVLRCGADEAVRKKKAIYTGVKTCLAAHNTFGGEVSCEYGCLGYGDCMRACPFGAITMVNGLPKIDKDKCTACGRSVISCPRNLITLEKIDSGALVYVACSNPDKGPRTRKVCSVGCIACGLCQKLTGGIFYVENNLARVKYDKVRNIGNIEEVINKCPTRCSVTKKRPTRSSRSVSMAKDVLEVNSDNFKTEVLNSHIPVLVDFWAEWCMPCRMIAPIIEELSGDYKGRIKFVKVNVDDNARLATDLEILSIPVLIIFKNGKEIKRIQGANPKPYIQKEIDACIS